VDAACELLRAAARWCAGEGKSKTGSGGQGRGHVHTFWLCPHTSVGQS
jgi:hypothetical protein